MPFLTLSGADVDFLGWELTEEALPTTKRVELVGKKEFAAAELDPEYETFVVHKTSLSSTPLTDTDVHPSRIPQIAGLIAEEAPTKVPAEFADLAVFSPDLASELPEHIGINDHTIELVDGQQPPYRPILRA